MSTPEPSASPPLPPANLATPASPRAAMPPWRGWMRRGLTILLSVLGTVVVLRAWESTRGPALSVWHRVAPEELGRRELAKATWADYVEAERRILNWLDAEVVARLEPEDRVPYNRYFAGSRPQTAAAAHKTNWNRSYVLEPAGTARGVVALFHGMTDSPYSLRHVAEAYRQSGFVAVGLRLPGHGTVPGGLVGVEWEDWDAAARLAIREARRRLTPGQPFHLVGYSTGAALAVKYALDETERPDGVLPDRLVLLSPMIGVSEFARFAGLAGLPSVLPAFSKAAWLSIQPEFNPFKYNSFPVNGARQSYRLSRVVQDQVARLAAARRLERFPPVISFCSVVDSTVSVPAVVSGLYQHLPHNGSELVIFDLNRAVELAPLLRVGAGEVQLPPAPRPFTVTMVGNVGPGQWEVAERRTPAGAVVETTRALGLRFPPRVFSLSHVAIPFPVNDPVYGLEPTPAEELGFRLGTMGARGELGVLVVPLESQLRISCNPFFPYLLERAIPPP